MTMAHSEASRDMHFTKQHSKQTFNARFFRKEHKVDVAKEIEEVIANMDDDLGELVPQEPTTIPTEDSDEGVSDP